MIRPQPPEQYCRECSSEIQGQSPASARSLETRAQQSMFFGIDVRVARLLSKFPGKKTFGIYRFQPLFFLSGALLEFSMINWEAGPEKHNFYKTFLRSRAREIAEAQIEAEARTAASRKARG